MKKIIDRLTALKAEAEDIQYKIETELDDGESLAIGLYDVDAGIDRTIGAILGHAHRHGNLSFETETKPPQKELAAHEIATR